MRNTISFSRSIVKTLSAVEAEQARSNQHELNGVAELKKLLGENKITFRATFSTRGSNDQVDSDLTWYDAREDHPTRSEFRLYFQTNSVMSQAKAGSTLYLGFDDNGAFNVELVP
ncbi:hypothetical protein KDW99_19845 [Marinomonas rhizomae]|uniref:hypothetical protein n=1 Tax=Marinomonas rhizomae TaxID=491948 RepID=UPI002104D45E|nr:hypothetical protein [Marinomonas rhizomae]UTV99455.1 hypothetical protein KDW99_19845 [Marinomonas rhizomae]